MDFDGVSPFGRASILARLSTLYVNVASQGSQTLFRELSLALQCISVLSRTTSVICPRKGPGRQPDGTGALLAAVNLNL